MSFSTCGESITLFYYFILFFSRLIQKSALEIVNQGQGLLYKFLILFTNTLVYLGFWIFSTIDLF